MGVISKKLASRFRKAKKQVGHLRRQVATDFAHVPQDVKSVEALVRSGRDPLHAAYVAAQNFTSFFMEEVTQFPEFDSYWKIYGPAQKEYVPDGPPISPLRRLPTSRLMHPLARRPRLPSCISTIHRVSACMVERDTSS